MAFGVTHFFPGGTKGQYEASMEETLRVLEAYPMTLGDRAIFQMGLLYAHPENARADSDTDAYSDA